MVTATQPLPLLTEPLAPGLTTLEVYAGRHQVSIDYIRPYWLPRPQFPAPVGRLAGRGRNRGGRARKVYVEKAIDGFRAGQPDLNPRTVKKIRCSLGRGDTATLGRIARQSVWESGGQPDRKTISQYRSSPGFPRPVRGSQSGREEFNVGQVVDYINSRPGRKAPAGSSRPAPRRTKRARRKAA